MDTKLKHIPFEFFEYHEAEQVRSLFLTLGVPRFYIAGGYFRDLRGGVKWKDIDVFIPGTNKPGDGEPIRYVDIDTALNVEHAGLNINVIKLMTDIDLAGVFARMDIGLCQIGMDMDGQVKASDAYFKDAENKTITIYYQPHSQNDQNHIDRVKAKFPDYSVINAWSPN